jgi:hypothetical protein
MGNEVDFGAMAMTMTHTRHWQIRRLDVLRVHKIADGCVQLPCFKESCVGSEESLYWQAGYRQTTVHQGKKQQGPAAVSKFSSV